MRKTVLGLDPRSQKIAEATTTLSTPTSRQVSPVNMENCNTRPHHADETIFRWDDLPFEIREQVFDEVGRQQGARGPGNGYFCYRGEMPDLVIALRSLPRSHAHVLQWYAKMNTTALLKPCYPSPARQVAGFNKEEMAIIGRAVIELSELLNDPDYRTTEKPTYFTKQFPGMTNLRSVQLYIDLSNDVSPSDMEDFITQFPFFLQGCSQLSKVKVEIPTYGLNNPWRKRLLNGVNKRILQRTGVQGEFKGMVYAGIRQNNPYEEAEMWSWVAPKGKTMDWTQELGWKCKNRCSTVEPPAWNFWEEFCGLDFEDGRLVVEWWESTKPTYNIVFG